MRINPSTGEIISYEDYFCPNCNAEIDAGDDYCDECDQYLGEIVQNGGDFSGYSSNEKYNTNDSKENNTDDDKGFEHFCYCILLIWVLAAIYFTLAPSSL